MLNKNIAPYFDDFDESKLHLQVMYKPAVAVQARELNEMVSIISNQIQRFGENIFKDGAMVIPGQISLDLNYQYVQLQALDTTQTQLLDPTSPQNVGQNVFIYGATTGLKAQIVKLVPANGVNPDTIYVKYLNSGGTGVTAGTIKQFVKNEVLSLTIGGPLVAQVQNIAAPVGAGSAASIAQGVYFVFGYFVLVTSQTIILDAYDSTPTFRVGLTINESYVTSLQDSTLNDNAAGSPNYAAPGADRYVIDLVLDIRELTVEGDPNFIELMRVEAGIVTSLVNTTAYSIIEDEMAKRTFEANGNFTTVPFKIDVREDLLDASHPLGIYTPAQGGDITKLAIGLEPGIAYVDGYRWQNLVTNYTTISKARNTALTHNGLTQATLGNYIVVDRVFGFPTYDDLVKIQLYNTPISSDGSSAGTQIGTAYIRGVEYDSGTVSNGFTVFPYTLYDFYLFNISLNAGYTFNDVKSYYCPSSLVGANGSTGNVVSQIVLQNATGLFAIGDTLSDGTNSEKIISYDSSTGIAYTQPLGVGTIAVATVISNGTFSARLASRTTQFDVSHNILIYPLPQSVISTIRGAGGIVNTSYILKKTFIGTTSNGNITFTAGTNEAFAPFNSSYSITVEDATGSAGQIIPTSITNIVFGPGQTTITFNNIPSGTHTVKLSAPVFKSIAQERSKTLVDNTSSPLVISAPAATTISLALPDIYQIISITETPVSGPTVDLTAQYALDNGQRDNLYDLGKITLVGQGPASTSTLTIKFSYFTHGSGEYFSVDSYNNFDGTENWYSNIPTYGSYFLRDCFDFRPVIDTNGTTFVSDSPHGLVQENGDILADFQYYLSRIDKIYLDSQGHFKDISGVPSLTPVPPNDPSDGMVLYILTLNPYTFSNKDLTITPIPNPGYTMYDIGLLEKRISNLEYYVSLSLLEQETASLNIIDSSTGLNRFKNGFAVDNFTSSGVADTGDGDYRVAMDFTNGIMRPLYNSKNINLVFNQANSSNFEFQNLKPNCPLITNKYTEAPLIQQIFATGVENVNPYAIYSWAGSIAITPPSDTWYDTTTLPDVTVTNNGTYNSVLAHLTEENALGTIWNAWQTDWTGVSQTTSSTTGQPTYYGTAVATQINPGQGSTEGNVLLTSQYGTPVTTTTLTTTNTLQSRTGLQTTITPTVGSVTVNNSTVNTGIIPFIRSKYIGFTAKGLKPFTRFWAFFDTSAVSYACKPVGTQTGASDDPTTNLGDPMISNGLGEINGWFLIPPINSNDSLQFKTGTRVFLLTDDENNDVTATSFAYTNYIASGIIQTTQETITSTIVPVVSVQTVSQTQSLVSTSTTSSTSYQDVQSTTYVDPLAQSFLVSFIDENNTTPAGVFLSKMDLYFLSTDPILPVTLQIRTMVNGSPTQTVVPFSEVQLYPFTGSSLPSVLQPNTAYTSIDASVASTAIFNAPVFLQNNTEYCFVLMANSNSYQVYTATLGEPMINSDQIVSQQPYAGVLFLSKNSSTWTPNQTEDIKFTIYRCVFDTNPSGGLVYLTNDAVPADILGNLPFEFSKGSSSIRILHPNHGKPNGGQVTITIPQAFSTNNWNGINATDITPNITPTSDGFANYTVSNVELNTYMITLADGAFATSSGLTGPAGVTASDDMAMDVLYPLINQLVFSGTQLDWTIETTTTRSVDGTQETFVKDAGFGTVQVNENNYMPAPRLVASPINEATLISGSSAFAKKSLVLQANMTTTTSALSPVIDSTRISGIVVQNLVDNSTAASTNVLGFDDPQEQIISGTDITFNSTGNTIGWSTSNFSNITEGYYITIAGSSIPGNNIAYPTMALVTAVDPINKLLTIDNTVVQFSTIGAGDTITIDYYTNFVDEMAPEGGSASAKYICKQVVLQNPANSLTIYLSVLWPPAANVIVYYKILPPYSQNPWYSLNWQTMPLSGNFSNSNTFQDYVWAIDDIGDFSAVAIKVVLKSTDSTQIPQCSDFRVICLGT